MILLTLSVAIFASAAVWVLPASGGLVAYLAATCLYPQYLAVSIGTVDLSVSRIVVLVLLIRLMTRPIDATLARWRWIDILVVISFFAAVLSLFTNEAPMRVIEREGGRLFDTVLAYLVARLSLRTRADVFRLFQGLVIIALPLAAMGAYQSITGHNPYAWMREYNVFGDRPQEIDIRYGLYRADASFGEKISFGLFFAMVLYLNLAKTKIKDRAQRVRLAFMQVPIFIGLISAMSSAPMFSAAMSLFVVMMFPFRRAWPYAAIAIFAVCATLEVASDRHFYEVLTRFALNKGTASYRIGLINEALDGGMSGRWLTGFGYIGFGPGAWGHNGFNWAHSDLVNLYIGILARTGLVGLIPYLVLNGGYYWCLYRAGRIATNFEDRWMVWCIGAGLVGWNVAMLTVGALGQTSSLLYILMAVAGACPYLVAQRAPVVSGESDKVAVFRKPSAARIYT
jgi:hypothetical protein